MPFDFSFPETESILASFGYSLYDVVIYAPLVFISTWFIGFMYFQVVHPMLIGDWSD